MKNKYVTFISNIVRTFVFAYAIPLSEYLFTALIANPSFTKVLIVCVLAIIINLPHFWVNKRDFSGR